jgi:hypothetical protein
MAILVEGFTIVVRVEAIHELYQGGWETFVDDLPNGGGVQDGELAGAHFETRPEFQAWAEILFARGLQDAATIFLITQPGERLLPPDQVEAAQEILAETRDVALVYRLQPRRPEWLDFRDGRIAGTDTVVGGVRLREGGTTGLALPEGWSVERAVPLRYEPESGDEFLPTWHEFLRMLRPDLREVALKWGPDGFLAFGVGQPKPFGGRIHPGGLVIEEERLERAEDGTEQVVRHRWTKFPK